MAWLLCDLEMDIVINLFEFVNRTSSTPDMGKDKFKDIIYSAVNLYVLRKLGKLLYS